MPYPSNSQSGFSLVETLVAITILLIVITGPLTLVSNSARSTEFANDQVMAFFLAQEGLELVQAERDSLLIPEFRLAPATPPATIAWNLFTNNPGVLGACFGANGCGVSQNTNNSGSLTISTCSTIANCRLYYNQTPRQRAAYTHSSAGNLLSPYTRIITMNETSTGQVEVVSTVTWRSDGQRAVQEVQAVTYLFDVYGR